MWGGIAAVAEFSSYLRATTLSPERGFPLADISDTQVVHENLTTLYGPITAGSIYSPTVSNTSVSLPDTLALLINS